MGWWSEDIMGGDITYDIEDCFNKRFIGGDLEPTALHIEGFMVYMWQDPGWKYYKDTITQVICYLTMSNGFPISKSLANKFHIGILEEICEIDKGQSEFCNPEKRREKLVELQEVLMAYPMEGTKNVELPEQDNLFDVIYNGYNKGKEK